MNEIFCNDINNETLKKYRLKNIDTNVVNDILINKYTGIYMKAILYLFNFLLKEINVFEDTYILKTSPNSQIYISTVLSKVKVIIKLNLDQKYIEDILKEYIIGLKINNLRYIIPNYVYTIGSKIDKGSQKNYICFEYIEGYTLKKLLIDNKLTFVEFIEIFCQILLVLEIGQREMSFCHYDLHAENIMCKEVNNYKYTIPINDKLYKVQTKKYLPMILDFGLSTIKYDNKSIGSYDFPEYGMYNYLLSGVDMYKLLVSCVVYCHVDLRRDIVRLFDFYGGDDPYKINTEKSQQQSFIKKIVKEFVKKGSLSKVANYVPLDFFNWIYNNNNFKNIIIDDRNLYISLFNTTTSIEYKKLIRDTDISDSIDLIDECTNINVSYVILKYNIKILERYNLKSKKLEDKLKKLKFLENEKTNLIKEDKNYLNNFKKLEIPKMNELLKICDKILNIKINNKNKNINILIEKFTCKINFFTDILQYLQLIYTIKELRIEDEYKDILDIFFNSIQYKIYTKYNVIICRTNRWCKSLLEKNN